MEINLMINSLFDKDTSVGYKNLLELEELSKTRNSLYIYIDDFFRMLDSKKYIIRVRGFRLICKQAKWDKEDRINDSIDKILNAFNDDKPTAIRQYLQAIKDIIAYKKDLKKKIKEKIQDINVFKYKETMQNLISKDIDEVLELL